jgi:PAS domain S-box-containing protein
MTESNCDDNFSNLRKNVDLESNIAYLASFPELNPMIIVEMDESGNVTYLNPSARRIFPDLAVKKILHPYLEKHKNWIKSRINPDYLSSPYEIVIGEKYYLQYLAEVKQNQHIRVYGLDITETKQAENMIQKQNAILKSIIESPNTPIYSIDSSYNYTSFNSCHAAVMKALYGENIELGRNFLEYRKNPEDRKSAKNNLDLALHGESFTVETWEGNNEISRRFFEISHNPVKGINDQIIGAAVFAKDITERRIIEEALVKSKIELEERVKDRTEDLQIANDFLRNEIYARKKTEEKLAEKLKELQCLYQINNLDDEADLDLEKLYTRALSILAQGFESPDMICVRILVDGNSYRTLNWEDSLTRQTSPIKAGTLNIGTIEVGYINTTNPKNTHAFSKEENIMLNAVGELLGSIITRRTTEFESRQVEKRILLSNEIMALFWESTNVKDYLTEVVKLIHKWIGCDCAGVRLLEADTGMIPYIAYEGFSDEFINLEGSLSLGRDTCACVRIIADKLEPQDSEISTSRGSVYIKNFVEFINSLPEEKKSRYRGTCLQHGFKSIAVVPIKHNKIMFGAIHIADTSSAILSSKDIETLERVADLIGQGLYRFDIEERIRNNQTRLANAQKIAHLGDFDWDLRKNKINWSDEVYSIFGKRPQGFLATYQKFLSFVHPEDRDIVEQAVDAALYRQQPFNIEHRILLSDGSIGFVHEQAIITFDETGQPLKMIGTIQDITTRKVMEKQLLESSNYARTLIEVSLDPMMTISSAGKIMDVNTATEIATGLNRNQLVGTDFANYFDEPQKAREGYQRVFQDGFVRDYPLVLRSVNGKTLEVLYNASLYRNRAGEVQGVFAAARDVTQLKKIEEELHALSRQIVIAQENERRTIARELHDEIGQSLTALKIMLSQAVRLPDEKRQDSLKEAYTLASNLLQQVRELSLNLRPSMLDDLGLLPTLIWHFDRVTSQTGVRINFEHDGLQTDLPPEVNTSVYRIIQEAITNIVRHSGAKEALINIYFNNGILFIKIEDEGQGFSLADTNIKVTAGLSGMRERVLLLGGKLTLDTAPNQGTRIIVELPISIRNDESKK